jgi:uncharacterized Zn finger protein
VVDCDFDLLVADVQTHLQFHATVEVLVHIDNVGRSIEVRTQNDFNFAILETTVVGQSRISFEISKNTQEVLPEHVAQDIPAENREPS